MSNIKPEDVKIGDTEFTLADVIKALGAEKIDEEDNLEDETETIEIKSHLKVVASENVPQFTNAGKDPESEEDGLKIIEENEIE